MDTEKISLKEVDCDSPRVLNINLPSQTKRTSESESSKKLTFHDETFWKSCCGSEVDKRAVMYFSQLSISLLLMGFSMWQLVEHHDDCNSTQLYSGLLTLLIGLYLPAPELNKKKK